MDLLFRKKVEISEVIFAWVCGPMVCLIIASLIASITREEGTLGNGFIENMLADLHFFLRFPTFLFLEPLWGLSAVLDIVIFFLGFILNTFFWTIFVERIITISYVSLKKKTQR